jgi:hypothetical protein
VADETILLHSCTAALAGSESAAHLLEQKERIQQALTRRDVALVLDTSKSFLESVFKTILTDRNGPVDDLDFGPLYRAVREAMPLSDDETVCEHLHRVTNSVVHTLGELRNRFGAASHGNEAEMLVQFVDGMGGFIYRRHKESGDPELAARLHYNDYPEFNDFLDSQYDGFQLALSDKHTLSISVSELLFQTDSSAYREMLIQYRSSQAEDAEEPATMEDGVQP